VIKRKYLMPNITDSREMDHEENPRIVLVLAA
jgi:hypothetical protein